MGNNTNNLKKLNDVNPDGKTVLVRVDHNVVKKGEIKDTFRIDSSLDTIKYILDNGGKPILMTHVGRPRDKKTGEITISKDSAVDPIVDYLKDKLNIKIRIPEFDVSGKDGITEVKGNMPDMYSELQEGKIEAIYLPNTRWFKGEQDKEELRNKFAEALSRFADIYVNDAFGSWRPHATTANITKYLPSYAGLLMEKEIENLSGIYHPERPFVAVVAGSKFDTKIDTLNKLLEKADFLILGGVMYNAYLCSKYGLEINGIDEEELKSAKKFVENVSKHPEKLIEMPHVIESDTMEGKIEGKYRVRNIKDMENGTKLNYVLDIAKQSFEDETVRKTFHNARTFFVNAVMGYAPYFNEGTIALNEIIHKNENARKLFGGGDTLQEMKRLVPNIHRKAIDDPNYYLFTGGGAVLKAIQEGSPFGIEPVDKLQK